MAETSLIVPHPESRSSAADRRAKWLEETRKEIGVLEKQAQVLEAICRIWGDIEERDRLIIRC